MSTIPAILTLTPTGSYVVRPNPYSSAERPAELLRSGFVFALTTQQTTEVQEALKLNEVKCRNIATTYIAQNPNSHFTESSLALHLISSCVSQIYIRAAAGGYEAEDTPIFLVVPLADGDACWRLGDLNDVLTTRSADDLTLLYDKLPTPADPLPWE